jgi:hypothetical protein
VHRPDTNAENFRLVHDAYQMALAELHHRAEEHEAAPAVIDAVEMNVPTAVTEPRPLPPEFISAANALQASVEAHASAGITAGYAKLRNLVMQQSELLEAWEQAMLGIFQTQMNTLGELLEPDEVFRLIGYHYVDLANLAIDQWYHQGLTLRLAHVATKCANHTPPLEAPPVVMFQMRLAMLLAFVNIPLSNRIANLFYPKLPPQVRDWVMPRVEARLSAAKIFEMLPLETRRFWEQKLFPPDDVPVDWNAAEVGPKFHEVLQRCPSDWPGYALMNDAMPSHFLNQMVNRYSSSPSIHSTHKPTTPAKQGGSALSFGVVRTILITLYLAFRGVTTCHRTESYQPSPPSNANHFNDSREKQRIIDETKRRHARPQG